MDIWRDSGRAGRGERGEGSVGVWGSEVGCVCLKLPCGCCGGSGDGYLPT